jgi:hypothetical protein
LYSKKGGLMPAFPAGKVPFVLASAVACFSLIAVVLTVVWGQQVIHLSLLRSMSRLPHTLTQRENDASAT